ncbi:unnamed protein product [Timema podura]|uniref:Uncharacterized protein n=1 Tax=Timema podura TaxID=61482 RepID=A0ABN7PD33_TIMPD|nr:unnamed protein product [Timema podura]
MNILNIYLQAKNITENNRGRMDQAKAYIDQSKRLQGEIATFSEEGVNLNDKAHQLLEETELYINSSNIAYWWLRTIGLTYNQAPDQ